MLIVKIGNIFDSDCDTLVNTVNCVGVMGKGIALEFKKKYPNMFEEYKDKCEKKELRPGIPYFYQNDNGKSILNFPTKDHWRSPSKLSYITEGLNWFVNNYKSLNVKSIAFPALGCGNGGLSWDIVGPIMYRYLKDLPITVELYAPFDTSNEKLTKEFLEADKNFSTKIDKSWYLILQTIRELNNRECSLKVGRVIYQKICYVLTRNGVPTNFNFIKGEYGPYSAEAKEVITILSNSNMIVEKQLGKMINITVPKSIVINQENYSKEDWLAMKNTVDLFARIKSTNQAEMMATILYAYDQIKNEQIEISNKDIYEYVLEWKPYWKEVTEELKESIDNLAMLKQIQIVHEDL